MELPQIFSKIKRDIMSSSVLTPSNQLKVCHILKQSFRDCLRIENAELGEAPSTFHAGQDKSVNELFNQMFGTSK